MASRGTRTRVGSMLAALASFSTSSTWVSGLGSPMLKASPSARGSSMDLIMAVTSEAVDLWKYVDGDAERYLRAGVRRTLTANYRYADTVEAVADIHLMETPQGAASIFESE